MSTKAGRTGAAAVSSYDALLTIDQAVLEAIPAAVYVCAADGVIVRFNRRATELWGRAPRAGDTEERFCGSFRLFQISGEPLPHAKTPMEAALRTGRHRRDREVVIERPDGSRVVALVNIEPLKTVDGEVEGVINCFQDITLCKRSEVEMQERSSDLEDFFENAVVPINWVSGDGTILRANKAELELLGYASEEYVGHNIAEFHADQTTIQDILARLSRGESLDRFRARLCRKDGAIRQVLISSSGRHRSGELVHTRCITLDVTAEQAQRHFAAIVESSDDAIVAKDLNGVITSWNRGAERLFGYTAAEVVGKPITILMPLDRQDEEPGILQRIRRGERVDHYETVRRRKDGSELNISLTVSPVKDADGRIIGASKIARDITERKTSEEQRSFLMRELSHRSKNLLALVQGMARQVAAFAPDLDVFEDNFSKCLQGLARSHDLLVAQDWRGAPIFDLVQSHLGFVATGEGSVISADGPRIILTPAAAQSLGLAFHELATNAVKHGALSRPGGHISISWKAEAANGEPHLVLNWMERGGPRVGVPGAGGFGRSVVEIMVPKALGGSAQITFPPEGIHWHLDVPLTNVCSESPSPYAVEQRAR